MYPRTQAEHGARWHLADEQVEAAREHFRTDDPRLGSAQRAVPKTAARTSSDEHYVVEPCDELLGEEARRQNRFDWLRGDLNSVGTSVMLPVDAYYPALGLVIEYRERQHDQPVPFFDKPNTVTVSGVHRGEQRRLYDRRRQEKIPAHGLQLVVITPADLTPSPNGRLRRERGADLDSLKVLLKRFLYELPT